MTHNRIQTETVKISETGGVNARRFVTAAGAYPAAEGDNVIGVTRNDVAEDARAAVDILGRLEVETTAAAIAVGDAVMSDDAGKALTRTGTHYIAGYAVTAVPAAGGIVEILRGI